MLDILSLALGFGFFGVGTVSSCLIAEVTYVRTVSMMSKQSISRHRVHPDMISYLNTVEPLCHVGLLSMSYQRVQYNDDAHRSSQNLDAEGW